MMKHEFELLAGYEVSLEDYETIIEPMYNATTLDKVDFIHTLSRERFEVKKVKTEAQLKIETDINKAINEYREEIRFCESHIALRRANLASETDPEWIKTWKEDIKNLNKNIAYYRSKIKDLKWVLR